jgi:glycerophosphoryl diester phosphodiesterase
MRLLLKGAKIMHRPMIIAHHGASAYLEGDVIESFSTAIRIGVDMLEFDLRRTKDEVFVAYHDRYIDHRPISQLTYTELKTATESKGMRIPIADEVLELARSRIKVDVELKEEGYENRVIEFLTSYLNEDEFVITSFSDLSLKTIKDHFPEVKAGLLLGKPRPDNPFRTRLSELFPMKKSRRVNADFLAPHFRLLRFGFLGRAERNCKPIFVWTVNDEKMISKFLNDHRIEAIITDRPDVALDIRGKMFPNWQGITGKSTP